ncbi:putative baseplate assembly protein [Halomonas sp. HK25]|uniref:putative baseplate assembly protein n=1 Tax=Halomonas sp. HK25 TaxID=3394321 RepID=UPI0039FC6E5D
MMSAQRTSTDTGCDCCAGIEADTPRRIDNPPSLPAIAYRIGRHGDFVDSMRARLSGADTPALAALSTREASDFSLAITDALATSLDVLSFYTERFAQEHYLRTATERLSVREMARLIGYQLAPGVAAGTHLAFTLQTTPAAPAEPIVIPVGTRVQSVPGQDEQAQSFETVAPTPARAEWNAIAVQQGKARIPAFGDTALWLDGLDFNLATGDLLLIVGAEHESDPQNERWDVRVISSVHLDTERSLTRVRWKIGLGHSKPFVLPASEGVRIFTFRKRTAAFGSNAPDWRALSDDMKATYIGLLGADNLQRPGDTEEWPDFTVLATVYPERREGSTAFDEIHIEATIAEVAAAATAAAQGSAALAMHQAAQAGAGVVAAGGQLAQNALGFARQSAEGMADLVGLAIDDVAQQARTLIHTQGQAVQALQMSVESLVGNIAFDYARQIIGDRIAGLPQRIQEYAANGLSDPVEVAKAVLDELSTALADSVPATVLPDLQPVWDEVMAAVNGVQQQLEPNADGALQLPNWLTAVGEAFDSAGAALDEVTVALNATQSESSNDGQSAATIVRDVVDKLRDAIGDQLSPEHFTELLDLSGAVDSVQDWTASLFDAGGAVGQSLLALQKTIIEAAGAEFAKLGMDVARMAQQAKLGIGHTAGLLNPAQALAALQEAGNGVATHARQAGLTALGAAAAADIAALVTAAVTIARALPPQLAPDNPEKIADVARHFAAYGVARAGGSPVSEPAAGSLLAQVAALMPPNLLGPMQAAEQLLPLIGEAEGWMDAPRNGAQAAYQQIIASVDHALAGQYIVVASGRRKPLLREPDAIDISPVNAAVVADGWALLSVPNSIELYRITSATTASRAEYLLSGQTTRLHLKGELPGGRLPAEFEHAVRSLSVHVESEELPLAQIPLEMPVYGEQVALDEQVEALLPGQALALSGKRQRIVLARGAKDLPWISDGGTTRLLAEGDSLRLIDAPVRMIGATPHYLDPQAFGAAIGKFAMRLRLRLQDRDGQIGVVNLRGSEIRLEVPHEDDLVVAEIIFLSNADNAITRDRDRTRLKLAAATRHCYDRRSARLNANVAPATHGETVEAILGSGDGSVPNQRFALGQSPLTFVSAHTPSGRASTLELRVNDVLWSEVPTLHAALPDTRVYATTQNDDAVTTVHFGDGLEGARLPGGESNLRVRYRKGIGVDGNLAAGKLTTLLSRPLGVTAALNPEPATGGEDAETLARARDNAPLTVLTLERAVSIDDYANFARAFAGIDKAHALWIPAGPARGVFLTIAGVDGAEVPESSDTYQNLRDALTTYGDPLVPLRMLNYTDARFRCRLSIKVLSEFETDPVLEAIEATLREHFGFARRAFGQTVSVDEVAAVAQGVRGIEAVHVTRLYRLGSPPALVPRLFASVPVASLTALPQPAELLTLATDPIELEVLP